MSHISEIFARACKAVDRKKNAGLVAPEDIIRFDNIQYGADNVWNLLDVYRPAGRDGKLPVIIDVHGGGWVYGDKDTYRFYCMALAQAGFAVVNYSYRLAPDNVFPAGIEDTDAVVRFVLSHCEEYGFDTDRIFMVGDSAGAHMVIVYCCACTDSSYSETIGVRPLDRFVPKAVVLNCGVYDVESMMKKGGESARLLNALMKDLLGVRKTDPGDPWQKAVLSPASFVNGSFPPAFVMTATGDFLKMQPDYLIPRFENCGVQYVFKVYGTEKNKLGHVFECNLHLEEAGKCNEEEMDFLKKYC